MTNLEDANLDNETENEIEDQPLIESFIQRWAMLLAGGVLVIALIVYAAYLGGPVSEDGSDWGEFGDYLGGLVNPIVGFLTVWLLSVSLHQNQLALQQARAELKMARKAIQQAKNIQKSTEAALKAQVNIAEKTMDFTNAATLYKSFDEQMVSLRQRLSKAKSGIDTDEKKAKVRMAEGLLQQTEAMKGSLATILSDEARRLAKKYVS